MHNNRINSDWQFRCDPLPTGYAERYTDTPFTRIVFFKVPFEGEL